MKNEILTMDGPVKVSGIQEEPQTLPLPEDLRKELEAEAEEEEEHKNPPMQLVDAFAQSYLRDWIPAGFPTMDPEKQIRTAYSYAKLQIKIREEFI